MFSQISANKITQQHVDNNCELEFEWLK